MDKKLYVEVSDPVEAVQWTGFNYEEVKEVCDAHDVPTFLDGKNLHVRTKKDMKRVSDMSFIVLDKWSTNIMNPALFKKKYMPYVATE